DSPLPNTYLSHAPKGNSPGAWENGLVYLIDQKMRHAELMRETQLAHIALKDFIQERMSDDMQYIFYARFVLGLIWDEIAEKCGLVAHRRDITILQRYKAELKRLNISR
ncbi:MAG: hypothetical protein FWB71_03460, partial [Defluviitaleaceae bacterium]|nr:hypothetical protein [Defluviitaleaceae bacterium]